MYEQYLYKQQLLDTFSKDNQLVDNVKLHLREKIINKLKSNKPSKTIPTDSQLVSKICIALFMDYLQIHRLFHSASVFAPQAGYVKSQFSNEQLKSLFQIQALEELSILQGVIRQALPKGRLHEKRVETSVQTDDRQSIQNLENRLGQVDFNYKQKMVMGLKNVEDSQARFLKYKNDLNKRYKVDLQQQIKRIRQFEIANIRLGEQQKYSLKIKQYEYELEQSYRNKMEKLRQREADVIQRVTTKMKEIETYNFQARQKMLRDLESVKAREEEIENMKQVIEQRQRQLIKKG